MHLNLWPFMGFIFNTGSPSLLQALVSIRNVLICVVHIMCVGLNWASSIVLGRPGPAKVNGRLKSGYYQQKRPARFDSSGYSICGKRSVHESVFDSISPQLGPFSLSFQGRVRVFNDHPFYSAMEPFPGPSGPCILNHVY